MGTIHNNAVCPAHMTSIPNAESSPVIRAILVSIVGVACNAGVALELPTSGFVLVVVLPVVVEPGCPIVLLVGCTAAPEAPACAALGLNRPPCAPVNVPAPGP